MRKRRRVINAHPTLIKEEVSKIIAKPYGVEIKGEFIHKDRVKNIIRSSEDGKDYASYYIRKKVL